MTANANASARAAARPSRLSATRARVRPAVAVLLCLLVAGGAEAFDAPLDPWAEPEWQVGLLGLEPGRVGAVRWTEQIFAPVASAPAEPVSTRTIYWTFDDQGRLQTLASRQLQRGEAERVLRLRYRYDAAGRLEQIDDELGGGAYLRRRRDGAGRLVDEQLRNGAAVQRTVWRYDRAGREIERVQEQGKHRLRERRSYHPGGALSRSDRHSSNGRRDARFDAQGRLVRMVDSDLLERTTTTVRYPDALTAVRSTRGIALERDGVRRPASEVTLRVADARQWQGRAEEPEQLVERRETRAGRTTSFTMSYDAAGRPLQRREVRSDGSVCITDWHYHPSGLPLSVAAYQASSQLPCAGEPRAVDYEIEVDDRGRWLRHTVTLVDEAGRRLRAAEHRREIDDR